MVANIFELSWSFSSLFLTFCFCVQPRTSPSPAAILHTHTHTHTHTLKQIAIGRRHCESAGFLPGTSISGVYIELFHLIMFPFSLASSPILYTVSLACAADCRIFPLKPKKKRKSNHSNGPAKKKRRWPFFFLLFLALTSITALGELDFGGEQYHRSG